MFLTLVLASASCFTSFLRCLATSPSTVSLQGHASLGQSLALSLPSLFLHVTYRSCGLWAVTWLWCLLATGHHGDDGPTGHPPLCAVDCTTDTLPCEYTDRLFSFTCVSEVMFTFCIFSERLCLDRAVFACVLQARKAVLLLLYGGREFSWLIHIISTLSILSVVLILAIFVPDISNVFGVVGMCYSG